MSNDTFAALYARRKAKEPRRKDKLLDRRNAAGKSFINEFVDSEIEIEESREFNLSDVIDPKSIGKQKFTYDSEKGQNFDETNVKKTREGAKEILADAIEKAKTKAIQIREEARKLGYDEGHKEGFEKGEIHANQEFAPLFKVFEEHIKELSNFREKMYGKVEREMIEMVVALTKKIIGHEFSQPEKIIRKMLGLAVGSVLDKENMTIKIHPDDKVYAERFQPELKKLFNGIKNITFEDNPSLDRGGCMIETNFGTINANLEHFNGQIEKILTSLVYRSESLTPEMFGGEQTQLPNQEEGEPILEKKMQNENLEEEKSLEGVEGSHEEDANDIDDSDLQDVADPDQ